MNLADILMFCLLFLVDILLRVFLFSQEDDEIDHCTEEDYEKLIQYYAGVMNGLFHSYMSVPVCKFKTQVFG